MIKRAVGVCVVILGILLIAGAAGLTTWNIQTDNTAGQTNEELIVKVIEAINKVNEERAEEEDGTVSFLPGIYTPDFTPGGVYNTEPELKLVIVDGREYIGLLSIPILGLELSVMKQCDDKSVDTAPGRWFGSPYKNGFVIGGHNYRSHLGKIDRLRAGDVITFTDMTGRNFTYEVVGQELLNADQGDILRDEEWDLSLFTCTLAGNRRIVVRSLLVSSSEGSMDR